ncbi:MAG: right-handed parallel beta-helix repeat-containing protein [Actinomycetota bacterium]
MHRTPRRLLIAAAATAALATFAMPGAHATAVLVVDDDGFAEVGNCDAETPAAPRISDAVAAAAPDDIIRVCPGSYPESVTIPAVTDRLRILGAQVGVDARSRNVGAENESVVQPPPGSPGFSLLASNTVLDGFTVEGAQNAPGVYTSPARTRYKIQNNILTQNTFGLYVHSSGLRNTFVKFNRITDNNAPGAASGNGIYTDQGADDILIRSNLFGGHANGAILFAYVDGVTNAEVLIRNNRSVDDANFVNLLAATDFRILNNRTSDTRNVDDDVQGSAIRVGGQSTEVLIQGNRLIDPAFSGVAIRDDGLGSGVSNIDVIENDVVSAEANGLDVSSTVPHVVDALDNNFRDNGIAGISFALGTRNNQIRRNTASGNADFDCHDQSIGSRTAGTANVWRRNVGATDEPNGICKPPA